MVPNHAELAQNQTIPHQIDKWTAEHRKRRGSTHPFLPTSNLSRRSASAIARLRAGFTVIDPNPQRPTEQCECGATLKSSRHLLMDCTKHETTLARTLLLKDKKGPNMWESITNDNIRPKELIRFMATTGLLNIRFLATTDQEARDAGLELMGDI